MALRPDLAIGLPFYELVFIESMPYDRTESSLCQYFNTVNNSNAATGRTMSFRDIRTDINRLCRTYQASAIVSREMTPSDGNRSGCRNAQHRQR